MMPENKKIKYRRYLCADSSGTEFIENWNANNRLRTIEFIEDLTGFICWIDNEDQEYEIK